MIVNAHINRHCLHVEIVCADECERPSLLLQLLDDVLYHTQTVLLAAVLLAVGDDSYEHVVALSSLRVDFLDAHTDSIVERRTTARTIIAHAETARLVSSHVVVKQLLVRTVKGDKRHALLKFTVRLLYLADCLKGFVDAHQCLLADNLHASALVYYQKIEYSLHNSCFLVVYTLLFSYCACPFAACFIYYKNYRGEKLRRPVIFYKKSQLHIAES